MSEDNTMNEPTQEQLENAKLLLQLHGDVLHQLMQYPRFQMFVNANYDIQQVNNEETKNISFVVMEQPHQKVMENMAELMSKKKEEVSKIVTTSGAPMKNIIL